MWLEGGAEVHSSQVTMSPGWEREISVAHSGPIYFLNVPEPLCPTYWCPSVPNLHVYHLTLDPLYCPWATPTSHCNSRSYLEEQDRLRSMQVCQSLSACGCTCDVAAWVFECVLLSVVSWVRLSLRACDSVSVFVCMFVCRGGLSMLIR